MPKHDCEVRKHHGFSSISVTDAANAAAMSLGSAIHTSESGAAAAAAMCSNTRRMCGSRAGWPAMKVSVSKQDVTEAACARTHTQTSTHAHIHTHIRTHAHAHMRAHTHTHQMHTHTCTHTRARTHAHVVAAWEEQQSSIHPK